MRKLVLGLIAVVYVGAVKPAQAQSSKGFSLQVAGRWTTTASVGSYSLDNGSANRFAEEAQVMYTSGQSSFGLGYSKTILFKGQYVTTGQNDVFLEYRYVPAAIAATVAPYIALHGAVGLPTQECTATFVALTGTDCSLPAGAYTLVAGGGGGLLIALGPAFTMDLGAQYYPYDHWVMKNYGYANGNRAHLMLRAGLAYSWGS